MRHKRLRALGASVLCAALLSACGAPHGSSSGHLVVYSGQHLQTSVALVAGFERESGIKVSVRSSDESVLANQLLLEGDRSPADVFFSSNSPALEVVGARGLLTTLPASNLAQVPAADSSPSGHWVGVTARISMITYSTRTLKPSGLPTSILDLASPKWRGRLGLAPTESDFQPIVTSVALAVGETKCLAWLEGMKANAQGHLFPSNESMLAAIDSGAIEIGVMPQYYWYRVASMDGARSMHSALATFHAGDPGYVQSISGAGVLRASHQQAAAKRFVAFLVSPQGQAIIAHSGSFEYPLAHGVATPAGEPAYSSLHPAPLTVAQLGTGALALALLQKAQLL